VPSQPLALPRLSDWDVSDAVLSNGSTVRIRPITSADADGLVRFHDGLSRDSVYRRFFSFRPHLSEREVHRFTNVDGVDRMAFVATRQDAILGVGRFDRSADSDDFEEAEVAFVVDDAYQGCGVATLLLDHLAAYARGCGIHRFVADTLPGNTQMLNVFQHAGFEEVHRLDRGVVHVVMEIDPSPSALQAAEARSKVAAVRSVELILRPRSVAVIGAGRSRGGIGHEILRNILVSGFQGPVYPVHPTARSVASVRAYPNVLVIPDEVDLAVVAVPSSDVPEVLVDCATRGIRGAVIISAGFAETGAAGKEAQNLIVEQARRGGIRVVGPNCLGIINTAADVSLNASFAPVTPRPGRVAFSSQSGGLGIAVLEEAERRRIGLSSFVSVGNKCDISGNDLLQYWHQDPSTDVILLYLESFGNALRFARIAREVSRDKPIVAVKAGRSPAGTRAASSHTAALASPDVAVDALFRQAGVIRVDDLAEMFDTAQILASQPLPKGRRVAIVGNSGGPGILAADACEASGLLVPELSASTQENLRSFLAGAASVHNPVDMVASATAADYQKALEVILADQGINAVLAVFVPPVVTKADDVAVAVALAASSSGKTCVANFLGMDDPPAELSTEEGTVPAFTFPEPAIRALARTCFYGEWRSRPAGVELPVDASRMKQGKAVVSAALQDRPSGGWLDQSEVERLLAAYEIDVAPSRTVTSAAAAARAAAEIGFPVALKGVGPNLVHKSDVGAVSLAVGSVQDVKAAFQDMKKRVGRIMTGAVVQKMVSGVETVVGVTQDPSFGPLVMFGSGGTAVELLKDQAFRTLPLTDLDAAELVRSTRGSPLLFGYRGAPEVDVAALEQLLLHVGRMAEELTEVVEMDLNPVMATPDGATVVDARIRVEPVAQGRDAILRRMR
jgi:acetyl coenzyme A synthetase (ADP forming)-like protein